jgi:N-acetylmuramoyl-L-alanine amidase
MIAAVLLASVAVQPAIVSKPIPFPPARRAETAAYARRHYGLDTWRLRPRVVVEHVTASTSFDSTWAAFAADRPDPELGELPGVCAHFVVDTDGTIYQLVPLWIRCRHTIGMNQLAIGIEHVGRSDAEVLGNARQMQASLQLTLWLVAKYGIEVRNVIGHGESLASPLRYERYAAWRCMTHTDMSRPAMRTYRGRLRDRARAAGVPIGPAPVWVDLGC